MSTLDTQPTGLVLGTPFVLPQVNLLPPEIFERRRFRRVQAGLAGSVVVAAGVVGVLFLSAAGAVTTAQQQVDTAGSQRQALQSQVSALRDVTATYRRAADAQALLVTALGSEVRYSELLNHVARALPDEVWVKSATFSPGGAPHGATVGSPTATAAGPLGTVTFIGVAYTHTNVATWLDDLAGVKGLTDVRLTTSAESQIGARTVVSWTATADLSPDALSGRYTKTGP